MKEMNEYTAEVLRRVDRRKRERKARLRTAALCAPAVLTALILAAVLPKWGKVSSDEAAPDGAGSASHADPAAANTAPPSDNFGGIGENDGARLDLVAGIEAERLGFYDNGSVVPLEAYREIVETIAAAEGRAPLDNEDDVPSPGIGIVLHYSNGTDAEYELYGSTLKNTGTGQSFPLTSDEASRLVKLLGIEQ